MIKKIKRPWLWEVEQPARAGLRIDHVSFHLPCFRFFASYGLCGEDFFPKIGLRKAKERLRSLVFRKRTFCLSKNLIVRGVLFLYEIMSFRFW